MHASGRNVISGSYWRLKSHGTLFKSSFLLFIYGMQSLHLLFGEGREDGSLAADQEAETCRAVASPDPMSTDTRSQLSQWAAAKQLHTGIHSPE